MDWLSVISLEQSRRNVESDTYGDWYRDPWGWPETNWVAKESPQVLVDRLGNDGAARCVPIDVPKENFVARPAMILDPIDRLAYQAITDVLSKQLIGALPDWAYGWRLPPKRPQPGRYVSNTDQWERYRARLEALALFSRAGLTTDIVSFFASVPIGRLTEDIATVAGGSDVTKRLISFLESWNEIAGRSGIPQRCFASSVLAHFYMRALDDLLDRHAQKVGLGEPVKIQPCRWMDDIWVFGDDPLKLRSIQLEIQQRLRDLGLNLNAAKTDVRTGDALVDHVMELEHSAVDDALKKPVADTEPLDEMLARIVAAPAHASRTTVRFAATRIRDHGLFDRAEQLFNVLPNMPHCADHIGRLLRDAELWHGLSDWYLDYARAFHSTLPWSVFQLGTMFPSSDPPDDDVVDFFLDNLASASFDVLLVPLAASRGAAWAPDQAREAIASAAGKERYQHPFALRALAFSGRVAGVPKTATRRMLKQFPESRPSLQYLEERDLRPPKVTSDFAGRPR